jgi:hypothetical protein
MRPIYNVRGSAFGGASDNVGPLLLPGRQWWFHDAGWAAGVVAPGWFG